MHFAQICPFSHLVPYICNNVNISALFLAVFGLIKWFYSFFTKIKFKFFAFLHWQFNQEKIDKWPGIAYNLAIKRKQSSKRNF